MKENEARSSNVKILLVHFSFLKSAAMDSVQENLTCISDGFLQG